MLQVYCGHEYTLSNYRFALSIDPDNVELIAANERAKALRSQGTPTIPSTLAVEIATNPFLRAEVLAFEGEEHHEFLTRIRTAKDNFK